MALSWHDSESGMWKSPV